jgi:hypothetical protein
MVARNVQQFQFMQEIVKDYNDINTGQLNTPPIGDKLWVNIKIEIK